MTDQVSSSWAVWKVTRLEASTSVAASSMELPELTSRGREYHCCVARIEQALELAGEIGDAARDGRLVGLGVEGELRFHGGVSFRLGGEGVDVGHQSGSFRVVGGLCCPRPSLI